jgi:uncharacterized membrane protein
MALQLVQSAREVSGAHRGGSPGWRRGRVAILAAVFVLAVPLAAGAAEAQNAQSPRPERGVGVYAEYSGVVVPVGEAVRMDLTVENKGKLDETIALKLTAVPKDWRVSIKGGNFTVTGVAVPAGKTRTLTLVAEPEKGVGPGTYTFGIEGVAADGKLMASQTVTVTARERSRMGTQDIQITTSYPVLKGQTDSTFEFSLDVANKSENDRTFNLSAQVPENWDVNFKPAYESKQISSLRIRGGGSQTVAVQITPPRDATGGQYPVLVRVNTGESQAEAKLMVILTGIYKLEAGTPTGLLSLDAVRGKPATMSLVIKNTGSAVNHNITLSAFKPENWKVEFKPEKVDAVDPGAIKQVEATITPSGDALVGDYSVALSVDGEKASKTVEMRVTVRAPTAWGWIGVGLIGVVIVGMGGLFTWLGRR